MEVRDIYGAYTAQNWHKNYINIDMGSILQNYENAAQRAGVYGKESIKAQRWFSDVISKLPINRKKLLKDSRVKLRSNFLPGRMYAFAYDPKTKKTLPYYDRFPLVILLNGAPGGGFYGLNLHYLAPKLRAKFLSTLMEYRTKSSKEISPEFIPSSIS